MGRYFKAEFKRVLNKKGNIIALLILFGIILGGNILISKGISINGPIEANNLPVGGATAIAMMIGVSMALGSSSWMVLFIGAFVMGDEKKERAYLRPVEAGISRTKIVITKFIISMIIAISTLILAMSFHFLIVRLFFGWNEVASELVRFFFANILLELIPLLAIMSILILIYFIIKNEFLVTILFILFGLKLHVFLSYISLFAGKAKFILAGIGKYSPSGVFSKISSNSFNIISLGKSPFVLDPKFVSDLVPSIIINAIIIVAVMGITIIYMNRSDLD